MNNKPQRASVDWEAIEREYRAGQLSVAEIGRGHGISHTAVNKRAKRDGWKRDLAQRVRQEVAARLVSAGVSGATEAETIETAAARGVEIVRRHREDLSLLNGMLRKVMDRVTSQLDGITPDGPALGEKETILDAIEKGSRILARTVPLERQAFNLDAADENSNDGWGALIDAVNQRAREKQVAEGVVVIEHEPPRQDEGMGHPTGIRRLA